MGEESSGTHDVASVLISGARRLSCGQAAKPPQEMTALAADEGRSGETVPVRLHAQVTEVGTLDLWRRSTRDDRRWKLEFNVRDSAEE